MSVFKRFVTTVHQSVDRTLSSIENHEAVVDAALQESRQSVARAKVRLARLEKDGTQQRKRVAELAGQIDLWNERARSVANDDREKALACMQRRKLCGQELQAATVQMQEHDKIISRIRQSISDSSSRVQTLQSQRNQMSTREAAACAGKSVYQLDGKVGGDVEAAIERWEVAVSQSEVVTENFPVADTADALEESFLTEEESTLLESELDALLKEEGGTNE